MVGSGSPVSGSMRMIAPLYPVGSSGVRTEDEPREVAPQTLAGTTWVLTGAMERFTRTEATSALKALGARVSGSVSKKTSFVVVGADPGSKYDAARDLGIRILDEAELASTLETGVVPGAPAQ